MPEITRDEVAHLARLSRLALDDDELDGLAAELEVILGAVAQISQVTDAADVRPTTHAVPVENVTRPDVVLPSLARDEVLAGAPAAEEGRFGVRVNAVGPGMLTDGMAARLISSGDLSPEALDIARGNIPLRRFGTATDVAEAVCFLASARAGFVSGQVIYAAGGPRS